MTSNFDTRTVKIFRYEISFSHLKLIHTDQAKSSGQSLLFSWLMFLNVLTSVRHAHIHIITYKKICLKNIISEDLSDRIIYDSFFLMFSLLFQLLHYLTHNLMLLPISYLFPIHFSWTHIHKFQTKTSWNPSNVKIFFLKRLKIE